MPTRSPSLEVLRLLRQLTVSRRSAIHRHPKHSLAADCLPCHVSTTPLRQLHTSARLFAQSQSRSRAPATHDRGPASTEDTQTDFGAMDILANTTTPATSIDACTTGGFHLNNGIKTTGGSGVLLVGGEAFTWRPWDLPQPGAAADGTGRIAHLLSAAGILSIPPASFALLELLYPRPDLLIVGTGAKLWMLSPQSRAKLSELGIRVDVMDTANAAAAYNLLATERGVDGVAGALLPVGWLGKGKK